MTEADSLHVHPLINLPQPSRYAPLSRFPIPYPRVETRSAVLPCILYEAASPLHVPFRDMSCEDFVFLHVPAPMRKLRRALAASVFLLEKTLQDVNATDFPKPW